MTHEELYKITSLHRLWVEGAAGGKRACFRLRDLSGMDLSCEDLRFADFYGADLQGANFYASNLCWANIAYSDLRDANLSYSTLDHANLSHADLKYANLYGASFDNANLEKSSLKWAALNWLSRELVSEILWRNAKSDQQKQLATWIGKDKSLCWDDFMKKRHKSKQWAIDIIKAYSKPGDYANEIISKWENKNL